MPTGHLFGDNLFVFSVTIREPTVFIGGGSRVAERGLVRPRPSIWRPVPKGRCEGGAGLAGETSSETMKTWKKPPIREKGTAPFHDQRGICRNPAASGDVGRTRFVWPNSTRSERENSTRLWVVVDQATRMERPNDPIPHPPEIRQNSDTIAGEFFFLLGPVFQRFVMLVSGHDP